MMDEKKKALCDGFINNWIVVASQQSNTEFRKWCAVFERMISIGIENAEDHAYIVHKCHLLIKSFLENEDSVNRALYILYMFYFMKSRTNTPLNDIYLLSICVGDIERFVLHSEFKDIEESINWRKFSDVVIEVHIKDKGMECSKHVNDRDVSRRDIQSLIRLYRTFGKKYPNHYKDDDVELRSFMDLNRYPHSCDTIFNQVQKNYMYKIKDEIRLSFVMGMLGDGKTEEIKNHYFNEQKLNRPPVNVRMAYIIGIECYAYYIGYINSGKDYVVDNNKALIEDTKHFLFSYCEPWIKGRETGIEKIYDDLIILLKNTLGHNYAHIKELIWFLLIWYGYDTDNYELVDLALKDVNIERTYKMYCYSLSRIKKNKFSKFVQAFLPADQVDMEAYIDNMYQLFVNRIVNKYKRYLLSDKREHNMALLADRGDIYSSISENIKKSSQLIYRQCNGVNSIHVILYNDIMSVDLIEDFGFKWLSSTIYDNIIKEFKNRIGMSKLSDIDLREFDDFQKINYIKNNKNKIFVGNISLIRPAQSELIEEFNLLFTDFPKAFTDASRSLLVIKNGRLSYEIDNINVRVTVPDINDLNLEHDDNEHIYKFKGVNNRVAFTKQEIEKYIKENIAHLKISGDLKINVSEDFVADVFME